MIYASGQTDLFCNLRYLPSDPNGCGYHVTLDGKLVHSGTTQGALDWVARTIISTTSNASANSTLTVTVDTNAPAGCQLSVNGATFWSTESARGAKLDDSEGGSACVDSRGTRLPDCACGRPREWTPPRSWRNASYCPRMHTIRCQV